MRNNIQVYGAERCHKTRHYIDFLNNKNLDFTFFDVEKNEKYAEDLRNLYTNRRLNFPTLMLKDKKLRNPSDRDLDKWLIKKGF